MLVTSEGGEERTERERGESEREERERERLEREECGICVASAVE